MDIYSQVKQHLKLASDTEVASICGPLFKHFGISYFSYNRVYADGTKLILNTNSNFIDWVYKNKLTVANSVNNYVKAGIYFPKNIPKLLPKQEAHKVDLQILGGRNYFNIDYEEHSCNIIERSNTNYCEIFDFVGPVYSPPLVDFYISNVDILKHFINYFKTKSSHFISKLDQHRLIDPAITIKKQASINESIMQIHKANFYQATQLERFPIQTKYGKCSLTKQEINCLVYLFRGRTAKQTAKSLNISPKTVEFYIETAKQKLGCYSKSELIDKIIEINLFNLDYLNNLITQKS